MWRRVIAAGATIVAASQVGAQRADAQTMAPARQSLADAWWTGPMLANSAAMLPRGHLLVEPYVYDVDAQGSFDAAGTRHGSAASHSLGSLTYIIYGLTDRVALGVIPVLGYNATPPRSSRLAVGDPSLLVQFGLSKFRPGNSTPATAVSIEETFPTARYDRLGGRVGDGFGSGAYTTTLEFLSQDYFWLPNGRVLRMRFDASHAMSSVARVNDESVYATAAGFQGRARPGASTFLDLSSEYSLSRAFVLALDVTYKHAAGTLVTGMDASGLSSAGDPAAVSSRSAASDAVALAPAVEYSWSPLMGVLLGARIITAGRSTAATITPAIAIDIVH